MLYGVGGKVWCTVVCGHPHWVGYVCTAGVVGGGPLSLQDGDLGPNKKSKPSALIVVNTSSPQKQTRSKTEEVAEVRTYVRTYVCLCVHVCMCVCLFVWVRVCTYSSSHMQCYSHVDIPLAG